MEAAKSAWRPEWTPARKNESPAREWKPRHFEGQETYTIGGCTFVTEDGVFSPGMFGTAHEEYYKSIRGFLVSTAESLAAKPVRMLEVGCGVGINGILVAHACADVEVCGLDIVPTGVRLSNLNAEKNGVAARFNALESDMFSALEGSGKKFDMIYYDCPIVHVDESQRKTPGEPVNWLDHGMTDPYYKLVHRFAQDVEKYTAKDGKILVKFIRGMGNFEAFQAIVGKYGWKPSHVFKAAMDAGMPPGCTFEVYELLPL